MKRKLIKERLSGRKQNQKSGAEDTSTKTMTEKYSQGIMGDSPCILRDGLPMKFDDVVDELNWLDDTVKKFHVFSIREQRRLRKHRNDREEDNK